MGVAAALAAALLVSSSSRAQDEPAAPAAPPDSAAPEAPAAPDEETCLGCHDKAEGMLAEEGATASRPIGELLIDSALYKRTAHGQQLACADCHAYRDEFPHPKDAPTASCATCHADQAAAFATSVHAIPRAGEARSSVDCSGCHGVHDVLPPSERDSRLYPLNVYRTCGQCHFSVDPAQADLETLLAQRYTDDVHGEGILKAGLVVAANCVSCHGGHQIKRTGDPESRVSRAHVDETCGVCHVGVAEQFHESVHYAAAKEHGRDAATCTDCHVPHDIARPDSSFLAHSIEACSRCHVERAGSFRQTYHGKVAALGLPGKVATCASCHGAHRILAASDSRSSVNPDHRLKTCSQCHEQANAEFASYLVHADPDDAARFPRLHFVKAAMEGLLTGTLVLGVLHAIAWLVRASADGDWKRRRVQPTRWLRRWRPVYLVYHMWLVSSVLLLALTGLPLHYADRPLSLKIMNLLGGPIAAGWVHRFAATALAALYVAYVAQLVWRAVREHEGGLFHGPNTMLPRLKDLHDLRATLRWFAFRGPRPRFDRWTYWEKFDFWAAFWGLVVIGLSGLMLWFPEAATRVVPGWVLNAAVIVHGHEAQLVIAFIFTVHVFHANLRPDKFPIDTAFLTGRLTEEQFREDRPLEYERAVRTGTLEGLLADPPSRRRIVAAYLVGGCALALGFFFLAGMIVASLGT